MAMQRIVQVFLVLTIFICGAASAQTDLVRGRDYTVLEPAQVTDTPNKIVVTEFFSYACPHCRAFFSVMNAWAAKLPSDVILQRVPVTFGRKNWRALAAAYYAMEATNTVAKLDGALFEAIHGQNLPLNDENSIFNWVGKNGIDATAFKNAYSSFGVNTQMNRAEQMARSYQIQSVPTIVVNGKYVVRSEGTKTQADILARANKLIAIVRAERAAGK